MALSLLADVRWRGRPVAGDVHAEHPRRPLVDRQQRREHAQHGGFAGPVRPEDAENLPLEYLQVNAINCAQLTEGLHQPGGVNSGGFCHGSNVRGRGFTMATRRYHRPRRGFRGGKCHGAFGKKYV